MRYEPLAKVRPARRETPGERSERAATAAVPERTREPSAPAAADRQQHDAEAPGGRGSAGTTGGGRAVYGSGSHHERRDCLGREALRFAAA